MDVKRDDDIVEVSTNGGFVRSIIRIHDNFFGFIERNFSSWFLGIAARFSFASVLGLFYLNSAWLKLGDGFFGFLSPSVGAFASIVPYVLENAEYDISLIPFFPYHLVVIFGMWMEALLPILITLGLFTRIAAFGMIIFIAVQSFVDIVFHGLEAQYVGAMFDRSSIAVVFDQRLLWIFVLIILIIKGAGIFSLDNLLKKYR
jgi:putative oxidoreductase